MPASECDLLSVRVKITLSRRNGGDRYVSAKATYASSSTRGPLTSSTKRSSAAGAINVPDGELGLGKKVRFAPRTGQGEGSCQSGVNGTDWKRAPCNSARVLY